MIRRSPTHIPPSPSVCNACTYDMRPDDPTGKIDAEPSFLRCSSMACAGQIPAAFATPQRRQYTAPPVARSSLSFLLSSFPTSILQYRLKCWSNFECTNCIKFLEWLFKWASIGLLVLSVFATWPGAHQWHACNSSIAQGRGLHAVRSHSALQGYFW